MDLNLPSNDGVECCRWQSPVSLAAGPFWWTDNTVQERCAGEVPKQVSTVFKGKI